MMLQLISIFRLKRFVLIGCFVLATSCKSISTSDLQTIDFKTFEITVPNTWRAIEIRGIDSYVGGIVTNENDTLVFDIGWYSYNITNDDFPLVFDKESYEALTEKEKNLLKSTKHLLVDSLSSNIDFKNYPKQKTEHYRIDCYDAKIVTPINKGFGITGIYIDSLKGSKKLYTKSKMALYGTHLSPNIESDFTNAMKTIKFKKHCL
ncbi:hypothetical protein [Myroides guanonis]|uniref:Uncharacterized protein n=1 Tax=Myroides guanonis TaxID=1150112 RepID=A0A1I3U1B6_9FLAO|nr:hypothetical protein [Myroides guanonis]SFJ76523.1 hypothetical protein SAMN04487893_11574 [Myroides guanonis]